MQDIILREIARLSVDCVKEFRGEYSDEILAAFTLIGKYLTIASLPKEEREDISAVTNEDHCPLCILYKEGNCKGCPLVSRELGVGCGHIYDGLKYAATNGTFLDTAFNLSKIARDIMEGSK